MLGRLGARAWWLPLVAGLAALALRLVRLDERSLWLDEAFTAWLAAQPVATILTYPDYHPPLYTLFLHFWARLGPWAASDAGLRLPSALASAAGVGLSTWLVRRLRLPGARLVAILGITCSLSVWYAQEARMYALPGFVLLAAAAALALLAALPAHGAAGLRRTEFLLWTGYAIAMTLALYLHYDALVVGVGLNLTYLVLVRPDERRLIGWAVANFVVVVLYVPHLPALVEALSQGGPTSLTSRLPRFIAAGAALAIAAGLMSVVAWRVPRLRRPLVAAGAAAFLLALDVLDLSLARLDLKRHVALALPIALTFAGVALGWARIPWQAAALLVAAGLPSLYLALFVHPKEEWRAVAEVLQSEVQASDVVLVYRSFATRPLTRYYHGERPPIGVDGPAGLKGLGAALEGNRRVWLVELTYMQDPPTLAPYLQGRRRLARAEAFTDLMLRRFDPVQFGGSTPDAREPTGNEPLTFIGSGDQRSPPFTLRSGDERIRWQARPNPGHSSCYYESWLEATGGASRQRIAAFNAARDGRSGELRLPSLAPGEYRLSVESGCDWSMAILPQ
ncbi:MAG: hypothetical protein HY690_06050 [Chloroflexi bacterium]|nr:hypothetical protein [Chloroflexota bacterium]